VVPRAHVRKNDLGLTFVISAHAHLVEVDIVVLLTIPTFLESFALEISGVPQWAHEREVDKRSGR